jgi:hypothetical protein
METRRKGDIVGERRLALTAEWWKRGTEKWKKIVDASDGEDESKPDPQGYLRWNAEEMRGPP